MKKNLFTFVERNDSNKQFENHCAPLYWRKSLEVAITRIQSPRLMINCNFATHGRIVMHGTAHLIADAKATLHN